ncbi:MULTISPECIES: AbgT family transporter [Amycolatopsis]|uniref:AbgT family transporter n=1 Tax=Amycolatopsis TaxID=1813 RepID=UPI000B8B48DD|nr:MULTISPECIES: AbgT family transporter [Amycolatopsis]OXM65167.1 p-aminobenzoyl-glutamate transporter [Amycolatopsis sp. KNN50.9b]
MSTTPAQAKQSPAERVLGFVERVGNRLPDPFFLFVYLFAALAVITTAVAACHVTVTVPGTTQPVAVKGLFTGEGVRFLLSKLVDNFVTFPPLGNVLVMLLAVGLAERAGLLEAAVRAVFSRAPRWLLPFAVSLVSFQAHVMADAGIIVIPPLAALVFRAAGRHPVAGAVGSFACVTGGYGAGTLLGSYDALLSGLTQKAVTVVPVAVQPQVTMAMNWFFTTAAGLLLPFLGAWLTARVLEPRLGPYTPPEGTAADESAALTPVQRKGLRRAAIVLVAYVVVVAGAWLLPGSPLRGDNGSLISSPLLTGLVLVLFLAFVLAGITYGVTTGTITGPGDVPSMMAEAVKDMAGYIVLILAISQFIAVFTWSNLGTLLAVRGAEFLQSVHLTGFAGILAFVVLVSVLNLFITSGSALWSLVAPVFVPAFMLLGYDPGFVQAAYRIGDSATQIITPLSPYLFVLLTVLRRYEPDVRLGTLIARMSIFVIPFWVVWVGLLAVFYFGDIPFGPGVHVHLPR